MTDKEKGIREGLGVPPEAERVLITKATFCDARKRDKEDVPVESGEAVLNIDSAITTVRLLF